MEMQKNYVLDLSRTFSKWHKYAIEQKEKLLDTKLGVLEKNQAIIVLKTSDSKTRDEIFFYIQKKIQDGKVSYDVKKGTGYQQSLEYFKRFCDIKKLVEVLEKPFKDAWSRQCGLVSAYYEDECDKVASWIEYKDSAE
ncbi:MAG: hypothetical protein LBQ37_02370 [Elusimicrobiota bacterium]|jgi:hypothetical protein|nr:hypothetical protein [Elusimicrobiota bacterium]